MPKKESKIIFFVTNLEFTGLEKSKLEGGGFKLDHITLKIDNHNIIIKQVENYKEIMEKLRKKYYGVTAKIIVKEDPKNLEAIREIVDNLCSLMSFMNGQSILPVKEIFISNDERIPPKRYQCHIEDYKYTKSVVPSKYFKSFLEKTYPNYIKFKDDFNLPLLFRYSVLMKNSNYLEINILLGYILLECLSDHAKKYYERKNDLIEKSKIKEARKILKKLLEEENHVLPNSLFDKIIDKLPYQHPTLQDTISKIMKDFKITYEPRKDKQEIYESRKYYIHRGISPKKGRDHTKFKLKIIRFINCLLIGILGYDGPTSYNIRF